MALGGERARISQEKELHWSGDNWPTVTDPNSSSTGLGIEFLDMAIGHNQTSPVHFTFFWTISQNWENRNYQVAVVS